MTVGSIALHRRNAATLQVEQSALLKRIREGETELFGRLVEEHQKRVFRTALYYVRDPAAADTLTQDTFIRAFEHIHRFREEARFETWLTRIAINLCLNYLKQQRRETLRTADAVVGESKDGQPIALEVEDPHGSPEDQLLRKEMADRIQRATARMSTPQKTVFQLRHYEGLTLEEIGQVTRMNIGTIKSHLFRAMQKVRDVVKDRYES